MPSLPTVGGDNGVWGGELNTWLTTGHNADGTHPPSSAYAATGLTGATAASRYAGATSSGHPVSGTFAVGDFVIDQTGTAWICITAGSPGSWAQAGAGNALPLSGGTMTGWFAPAVVSLTFGATISVNAALGNVFAVTLTASTGTIANPTSPVDGQIIRFRIAQDATGSRTVAWGSAYDFGSTGGVANGAPALTTTASKVDIFGFEYDAALAKWCSLSAAFPQGF